MFTALIALHSRLVGLEALKNRKSYHMPTIHAPDDVREQAKSVIKIFTETPDLKMKVNDEVYHAAEIAALDQAVGNADRLVDEKRAELTPLLNDRNDQAKFLNTVLVQGRKAIAGYFGEDSSEYELAGGTRKSERASPGRRTSPKPSAT
jgi:hypothetical protein